MTQKLKPPEKKNVKEQSSYEIGAVFYAENYKTLKQKNKEHQNKWKDISNSLIIKPVMLICQIFSN